MVLSRVVDGRVDEEGMGFGMGVFHQNLEAREAARFHVRTCLKGGFC